jgi:copper transport protein
VWGGWVGAVVGGALELLLQGPYASGAGVGKIVDGGLLDDTLHTHYGELHSLRLVLLGAVAVLLARSLQPDARPARWELVGGSALALGVAWTFSDAGHANTTSPTWFSVADDMIHLLSVSAWLGGLVMLVGAVLPRREPDELRSVLPTFSRTALACIVLLVASGLYSAFRGIGTVDAIFTTTYGRLVVAKVAVLAGVIAVASLSRRLVQRRTVAYAMSEVAVLDEPDVADEVTTERLRRSVFVEALGALLILCFAALLVSEPRGKEALAQEHRKPVSATASLGGGRSVTVTADPGTHGPVNFTVDVVGETPTAITASATQKAKQIGPLTIKLTRESRSTYDGNSTLPVSGTWEIDLVITTSTFNATTTDVRLSLY